MGEIFLETKAITKKFGDVVAVNNVDLTVRLGEIQGLIGENGSGKSTISSMICGIHSVTSGEMILKGRPYRPADPGQARANGIGMIVQEAGTVDYLSVAENIFLGEEKRFSKFGFINKGAMEEAAKKALAAIDVDIDVTRSAAAYNFETRKLIEIAKTLYYDPELLIVDETTTALSQDGREKIHRIMSDLSAQGKAVLFISHDLPELIQTCDCLTVLRDGSLVATIDKSEFSEDFIKHETAIEAEGVNAGILKDINLKVRRGEIVGIGGLSGSGIHELGRLLFGMEKIESGKVTAHSPRPLTRGEKKSLYLKRAKGAFRSFRGRVAALLKKQQPDYAEEPLEKQREKSEYDIRSIRDALSASIGYISKDRDKETLILQGSIRDNLCLSAIKELEIFGVVPSSSEKKFSKDEVEEFRIKSSSINQEVRELSGGNKQKVSFAKWIGNNSRILVFDSPTRGVDVGVKTTMYQLLYDLKLKGYAIVIISEELSELIGMSDRILIMKDGGISKEFVRSADLRDSDIIDYMI